MSSNRFPFTPSRSRGPSTSLMLIAAISAAFFFCVAGRAQDDAAHQDSDAPPILKIGAPAPDFSLPGVDGKAHSLSDYALSKVLVVIFSCNHCPTAEMYEKRIKQLVADYKDRGVAVVVIMGNDPKAERPSELGYTDVGDSFADMKLRAKYRNFDYPYLYDGDTQAVALKYGPTATPPCVSSSISSESYAMKAASTAISVRHLPLNTKREMPLTRCSRGNQFPWQIRRPLAAPLSGPTKHRVSKLRSTGLMRDR